MSGSRLARQYDLSKGMQRDAQRVRRLEVNTISRAPVIGTASYSKSYSLGNAASWSPDFSSPSLIFDTIGLTFGTSDITIPGGWIAWGNVQTQITLAAAAPTGETFQWGIQNSGTMSEGRSDIISAAGAGSTQRFGASIPLSPTPTEYLRLFPNGLGAWATLLGTLWTPNSIQVTIHAINTNTAAYT